MSKALDYDGRGYDPPYPTTRQPAEPVVCRTCEGEGKIHDADFSEGDSDQKMFLKQDTLRPCPDCSTPAEPVEQLEVTITPLSVETVKRREEQAGGMTKPCTCLGTCKGAAGLGAGWHCVMERRLPEADQDVHTEHCCRHGCKYGSEDCPVENGQKPQSFPCEDCEEVRDEEKEAVTQSTITAATAELQAKCERLEGERDEAERLLRLTCEHTCGTPIPEQSNELADISLAIDSLVTAMQSQLAAKGEEVERELLTEMLAEWKAADEERLAETHAADDAAEKWKAKDDWYGWNFHKGKAGGTIQSSLCYDRIRRKLSEKLKSLPPAAEARRIAEGGK